LYIVKTLRDHEAKLLLQALPGLYLRYSQDSSLLTRYVGLYSVTIRSIVASEIFCVVMLNNLPSIFDIHEIYDLKGSSVGRLSTVTLPELRLKALKDLDYESFYPFGIRLPRTIYRRLRQTLESDIGELRKMMITDFSLMLGILHLDQSIDDAPTSPTRQKPIVKPQLGISSLFAVTNVNPSALLVDVASQIEDEDEPISREKLLQRFVMKPLQLITCTLEETFQDHPVAINSMGSSNDTEHC
jgi:hypothetical protein